MSGMKKDVIAAALASLAVGAVVGWIAKPGPAREAGATETTDRKARKSLVSEPRTRIKTVTTVVTNTVHDTVTNMVEVVRQPPRGPDGWRAELERLKEENPTEYAARTNRMAQFRARMLQNAESKLETLAAIDTTGWSKRQLATHERYQELIARREELMEIMRHDSDSTEEQRSEAMEEMRRIGGELHSVSREERNTLLDHTISTLGYTGSAAAEIKDAITTIYSTTQEWGPPHGRRGGPRR